MIEVFVGLFGKMLLRAAVGSLIGAVFLRAAAEWVAKKDVPYGTAYGLYFVNHLIIGTLVIIGGLFLGALSAALDWDPGMGVLLAIILPVSLGLGLPAAAGVISMGLSLKYGRAILVTLVTYGLALAIFGTIYVLVMLVMD